MATLNWFIDKDHFAAHTEYGTYEVGDWGSGNALVNLPGVWRDIVPFATGKNVAQADYDRRHAAGAQ